MISDEGFRKKEHLLKSKEFSKVYKKGTSKRSNGVVLCVLPNGLEHTRLGFSISSKTVRRAVSRNRIRRLFREVYRKSRHSLKGGFDIIIVIRQDLSETISFSSAETTLFKLVKEAGLSKWKKLRFFYLNFIVTTCQYLSYNAADFIRRVHNTHWMRWKNTDFWTEC